MGLKMVSFVVQVSDTGFTYSDFLSFWPVAQAKSASTPRLPHLCHGLLPSAMGRIRENSMF
jgi:hypothetical protein